MHIMSYVISAASGVDLYTSALDHYNICLRRSVTTRDLVDVTCLVCTAAKQHMAGRPTTS